LWISLPRRWAIMASLVLAVPEPPAYRRFAVSIVFCAARLTSGLGNRLFSEP
jgi:hypothetical protein